MGNFDSIQFIYVVCLFIMYVRERKKEKVKTINQGSDREKRKIISVCDC